MAVGTRMFGVLLDHTYNPTNMQSFYTSHGPKNSSAPLALTEHVDIINARSRASIKARTLYRAYLPPLRPDKTEALLK